MAGDGSAASTPHEAETFRVRILTPDGEVFSGQAAGAMAVTACGLIEVLPRHEALLSLLVQGELVVRQTDQTTERRFSVPGGFLQVGPDEVLVLADSAVEGIDVGAAVVPEG